MNKIIFKNIDIHNILNKYDNQLTILELLNEINYDVKNIYINKFWDNIEHDKWIYIDNELILWLDYKDIKRGKEFIIRILKQYFKESDDYKLLNNSEFVLEDFCSTLKVEQNINEEKRGAHNKQYIIVSPDCFKELCMHVGTSRSKEIKKYYIELEKIFKFYLQYQNKYQELKNTDINKILKEISKNHSVMTENMVISYIGKSVLYLARIGPNEIKFGITNKIEERIKTHHRNFDIFEIIYVTICYNNREIENLLKQYAKDNNKLFSKTINGKNYTELISVDNDFTIDMIINKIKDECDVQYNYTDLQIRYNEINKKYENLYKSNSDLKHNYEILKYRNKELNEENDRLISNMVNLDCEIFKLKDENKELLEQLNKVNIHTTDIINDDNKENIKEDNKEDNKDDNKEDIILDNISNKADEIKYETKENNKPTKVKKEFKCMRCLECFSTGIILTQHMNRKNPCKDVNEVIEYKCEKCKKIFASQSGLNRHLKNVKYPCDTGKPKKIYKCEKCNKTFEKIGRYKEHINKQTKCDIIYQCNKCNHIFNNILNYTNHINKKKSCI
jgi:DNA-directed RNA polymerase subunit RPC12/RpoP